MKSPARFNDEIPIYLYNLSVYSFSSRTRASCCLIGCELGSWSCFGRLTDNPTGRAIGQSHNTISHPWKDSAMRHRSVYDNGAE